MEFTKKIASFYMVLTMTVDFESNILAIVVRTHRVDEQVHIFLIAMTLKRCLLITARLLYQK